MGWEELDALHEAWKDAPPAHVTLERVDTLLSAYLGVPQRNRAGSVSASPAPPSEEAVRRLVSQLNGGM